MEQQQHIFATLGSTHEKEMALKLGGGGGAGVNETERGEIMSINNAVSACRLVSVGVLSWADAPQYIVYINSAPNYLAMLHLLKCTVLH